ncbi:MAG: LysR family transcriptional regulator [Hyphomicrobiales bacterium]
MNWNAISFDWNQIRAFLATAEEGSLSAAARALNQTQPTLSRQISALEQTLKITLFERGPRMMEVTKAGNELLEHVRVMADAANRISLAASGQSQTIDGQVSITATDMIATYILPKILPKINAIAPNLAIELIPTNNVRDLIKREADIAIRHGRPQQAELIAKTVGDTSASLYASQKYFEKHETPQIFSDLKHAKFVGASPIEDFLPYLIEQKFPISKSNFQYTSSSDLAVLEMVRQGLGLGIIPNHIANFFDDLIPVMPNLISFPFPIWLVTHRELHTSRRIRMVYDLLAIEMAKI